MKPTAALALIVCLTTLILSGCGKSNYQSNMDARSKQKLYSEKYKSQSTGTIMKVITNILNPIEKQAVGDIKNQIELQKLKNADKINMYSQSGILMPKNENEYAMAWMGTALVRMADNDLKETVQLIKSHGEAEIARARAEAIRYLTPLVKAIYNDLEKDMGTPPTWADVGVALINQVPFVATVAGMYGLGVKGIENAGIEIAGTFTDSSIATDGSVAGAGNARSSRSGADASSSGDTNQSSQNSDGRNSTGESSSSGTTSK